MARRLASDSLTVWGSANGNSSNDSLQTLLFCMSVSKEVNRIYKINCVNSSLFPLTGTEIKFLYYYHFKALKPKTYFHGTFYGICRVCGVCGVSAVYRMPFCRIESRKFISNYRDLNSCTTEIKTSLIHQLVHVSGCGD